VLKVIDVDKSTTVQTRIDTDSILTEFNLIGKNLNFVSDSCITNVQAFKDQPQYPCFVHVLNLVLSHSFNSLKRDNGSSRILK
jgi:hypothetical protein